MLAVTFVRSTNMCAAHQEDLLCCHILHLCEQHHGPSTTPIRNILLFVALELSIHSKERKSCSHLMSGVILILMF